MIVNIIGGSPNLDIDVIKKYKADVNIGVDYGAYFILNNKLTLDIAVGDFDSISTVMYLEILNSNTKIYKYEKEKAKTDTEIALIHAFSLNAKEINLFGVTGKRLDHFLSAINLFYLILDKDIKLNIIDKHNHIYILKPGKHQINKKEYKYISFFAFNEKINSLTLNNFKYELKNHTLINNDSLCVSNQILNESGVVSFSNGILLVVESND